MKDNCDTATNSNGVNRAGSVEVVHRCPTCKAEITSVTFERVLDEQISSAVQGMHACSEKSDWNQRSYEYKAVLRANNRKAARKTKSMWSTTARGEHSGGFDEDDASEDEYEYDELSPAEWEAIKEWAVPALTFAVLVLIAVLRHK